MVLEEAESPLTGHISVEDVTVRSDDDTDMHLRRMVFTSNRNLIQSEAVLCPEGKIAQLGIGPASSADEQQVEGAPTGPVGKKGKGKAKPSNQKGKSAARRPNSASNNGQQPLVVDHSQLACDYHKGIVAGLSLIQPHISSISQTSSSAPVSNHAANSATQQRLCDESQPQPQQQSDVNSQSAGKTDQQQQQQQSEATSQGAAETDKQQQQQHCRAEGQSSWGAKGRAQALVVGLGGGGLPVFLNRHCHMDVQAVELDPVVVDLARRHFGFAESASLRVRL